VHFIDVVQDGDISDEPDKDFIWIASRFCTVGAFLFAHRRYVFSLGVPLSIITADHGVIA
jgi:hypothetical protein